MNQNSIAIVVVLAFVGVGIAFAYIGMTNNVKIPSKVEGIAGLNETNKVPESTEVPSNPEKIITGKNETQGKTFLSKETAKKIVESKLGEFIQGDPMFDPWTWKQSVYGDPILVRTVDEEPSYWRVPVNFKDKVLGYIDVNGSSGTIWRYGEFYESPDNLSLCPSVPTLITAAEAAELAEEITARYPDAEVSDPIFVHDGAKSKIAWMLKIEKNGEIISRVFLSGRYPYERRADEVSIDIGGAYMAFEENITEKEVNSILEGYDLILPYELKFDTSYGTRFYVIAPEDTMGKIKKKLERKNIFLTQYKILKNGEVISAMSGEVTYNTKNELHPILKYYGLTLKRFIWVYIDYRGSGISSEDGNVLKENLEKNKRVISLHLDYYE